MATKKAAAKPAAKPAPSATKHATDTKEGASEYDPNEQRRALEELRARHGGVDDAHRQAFDSLSTQSKRADLGGRTRATGVLRDGVSWAVQIDQAFSKYSAVVEEHYSRPRFSYFLDRLTALDSAIAGQGSSRDGTQGKRATSEEREKAARAARNKLIEKMTRAVGERAEKNDLAKATGTQDNLGGSILALVTLGRSWLAGSDASLKILCKSVNLTEELLQATLHAGEALTGAATDATLAGKKPGVDSPEVNLLEGWVLQEMVEAQTAFESAHEESRLVTRLSAGPSTRHVLGVRKSSSASQSGEGGAPTPPVTPA